MYTAQDHIITNIRQRLVLCSHQLVVANSLSYFDLCLWIYKVFKKKTINRKTWSQNLITYIKLFKEQQSNRIAARAITAIGKSGQVSSQITYCIFKWMCALFLCVIECLKSDCAFVVCDEGVDSAIYMRFGFGKLHIYTLNNEQWAHYGWHIQISPPSPSTIQNSIYLRTWMRTCWKSATTSNNIHIYIITRFGNFVLLGFIGGFFLLVCKSVRALLCSLFPQCICRQRAMLGWFHCALTFNNVTLNAPFIHRIK